MKSPRLIEVFKMNEIEFEDKSNGALVSFDDISAEAMDAAKKEGWADYPHLQDDKYYEYRGGWYVTASTSQNEIGLFDPKKKRWLSTEQTDWDDFEESAKRFRKENPLKGGENGFYGIDYSYENPPPGTVPGAGGKIN
jgi:hypothetical protein